jgi:hypothetical protein
MGTSWLGSEKAQVVLSKSLLVVAVAGAAGVIWFGSSSFLAGRSVGDAELMISGQRKQLSDLKTLVAKADNMPAPTAPMGTGAVSVFQSAMEAEAEKNDCALTEFISAPQPLPFLSRYNKDNPETTWQQVEVKAHIEGTARQIVKTLEALKDLDIPFELQAIELVRQDNKKQEAHVSAQIDLNILVQPIGATP